MNEAELNEANLLYSLTKHQGWTAFERLLKRRFKTSYDKLRKSNRDSAFYKLQGHLDEIDEIRNDLTQNEEDLREAQEKNKEG